MKKTDVVEYFHGNQAEVARALGIKRQAVDSWDDDGLIPLGRAYQLQVLTRGALKVDPRLYNSAA